MVDAVEKIKSNGRFHMQDASNHPQSLNFARAEAHLVLSEAAKGDLFDGDNIKKSIETAALVAGTQAAKRAHEFIPMHHQNVLSWIELEFEAKDDDIRIVAMVKAVGRSGLEMEALSAVSVAALTFIDFCSMPQGVTLQGMRIIPEEKKQKSLSISTPLNVGVLVISDRIIAGLAEDEAGQIYREGFAAVGCGTDHYSIISNDPDKLVEKIQEWLENDVDLIITVGGNGVGQRDVTLAALEPFFDFRLEGVEQSLYNIARINNSGFFYNRLAAGKIGKSIVMCMPIDALMARDALAVLAPNIHQIFEI